MVRKPIKPCHASGCRNLTEDTYCEDHIHLKINRHRYYDRYLRNKSAAEFYNSKPWRIMRQRIMIRDNGLCQQCLKEKKFTCANMVDHIIPYRVNPSLGLVESNLQSLCNSCHSIKTEQDKKKYNL